MSRIKKLFPLVMVLIMILTACTPSSPETPEIIATDPPPPTQEVPEPGPTPVGGVDILQSAGGSPIYFIRQNPVDVYMEALMTGTLRIDEQGCMRVGDGVDSPIVLWHAEFKLLIEEETVEVLNGDGVVVGRVGEPISMGGGQITNADIPGLADIPCSGAFWALGDIQPLDQQPPIPPAPAQPHQVFDGWNIYTSETGRFAFSYPPEAEMRIEGVVGFPTEEKPDDMSFDQYIQHLEETLPDDLCVAIELEIGFLYIQSPEGANYGTICGVSGIGDFEIVKAIEQVQVGPDTYDADGYQVYDNRSGTNIFIDEFFHFQTKSGNRITYGGYWASLEKTYEEYLLDKSILMQILSSYAETSGGTPTGSTGQQIRADLPRITNPQVSPEQQAQITQGINTFGFDLYHQLVDGEQANLIYSPYSISMAFSMVYAGARADTETQMTDVLHFLPQDAQHPAYNWLDQKITSLGQDSGEDGQKFMLTVANSTWGQKDYFFQQPFLEILAQHYGAGLEPVDFSGDPQQIVDLINQWIADKTGNKITDLLQPSSINPLTRLVLANAIYFKAAWLDPFMVENTSDQPFNLLDGSQVTVPMMHGGPTAPFYSGSGFSAVQLPYFGRTVDMMLIVPDSGRFEEVEASLDADLINEIRTGSSSFMVNLSMPKFDFASDIKLKDVLSAMGLTNAFDESANFAGIGEDLFISDALHKATITVNEEGTEAAAATAIVVGVTSMPPGAELTIDRPFIFAIIDRETGTILFLGRVMDPSQ